MYNKVNKTWEKRDNLMDVSIFKSLLEKIKTYSKCDDASTYSITRNLNDIYENLKYQHALWVETTNFIEHSYDFNGVTLEKNQIYNLLKYFDCSFLLNSEEFIGLLSTGKIKAANALLYDSQERQDYFGALQPEKLETLLNEQFDYLVIKYSLADSLSSDIDTRTALLETGYFDYISKDSVFQIGIDGVDVGWDKATELSTTSGNVFLKWGGDNITSSDGENILINFKTIRENIINVPKFKVRLRAFFYDNIASGKINITFVTYKDGTMQQSGLDFINVDGEKVQEFTLARQIYRGRINSSTVTCNGNDAITSGIPPCSIWLDSDEPGDDLGIVFYNTQTKTAIVSNSQSSTIDTDSHVWRMGTSGLDINEYSDMIINSSSSCDDVKSEYIDGEYGNSQRNVFTSTKAWETLLENFTILELASTENMILDVEYPLLTIDNYSVLPNFKILLKDQTDITENGVYLYTNKFLIKQQIDSYNFSAFIKEGEINKNKEYYLDKNGDGTYTDFIFIEGNSFAVRNRVKYKLIANHTLCDAEYFTTEYPVTDVDFTFRYYDSTSSYYKVSDDLENFEYYSDIFQTGKAGLNPSDKLSKKIDNLYLLRNSNEIVKFLQFTDGNDDIFETVLNFDYMVKDFQMINSTSGYFLSTSGILYTPSSTIYLNEDAIEFKMINNIIYYLTNDGLYVYIDKNYKLIDEIYPCSLIVSDKISYLVNEYPKTFIIDSNKLLNSVNWETTDRYPIYPFSKTKIGDWEIKDNELFLKDNQITGNIQTLNIPKIQSGDYRYYDGVNDYSDLNYQNINATLSSLNSSSEFTMEFEINPDIIRTNQAVFYFGAESLQQIYTVNNEINITYLDPTSYITFNLGDSNMFPYFKIVENGKTMVINSNKKLTASIWQHISIAYTILSTKVYAVMYVDGISVGVYSFQSSISSELVDIKNVNFTKAYIGKTEFKTDPMYSGGIKEFRIWNKSLNSAQVITRLDRNITSDDNLYASMIGYWKLDDNYATQYNIRLDEFKSSKTGSALFYGGLNNDQLLSTLQEPLEIQLSNDYLYVLDKVSLYSYSSLLDGVDSTSFFDTTYSTVSFEGTSCVKLTPPLFTIGPKKTFTNVNYSTIVNSTIDTYSLLGGTNGSLYFKATYDDLSEEIVKSTSNTSGWNILTLEYTTLADKVLVSLEVGFESLYNASYFKNLSIHMDSSLQPNHSIFQINIKEETTTRIFSHTSNYPVMGIYYNETLYHLRNNQVINTIYNSLLYSNTNIMNFAVIDTITYTIDSNNDVYEDGVLIYSGIDYSNLFYGYSNNGNTIINHFDTKLNMLVKNGSVLENIGYYPLTSNSLIEGTSFNAEIIENKVYFNNILLDDDNYYWGFNLSEIWGIYELNGNLIVGVKTINNEIQVWLYDGGYYNLMDNLGNHTFFISDKPVDMTIKDEYLIFINEMNINFFKIEGTKFNYSYRNLKLENSYESIMIDNDNLSGYSLLSNTDDVYYLSRIYNTSGETDLIKYDLNITKINNGRIIGEFGLVFDDVSGTSFDLELNNIILKDDLNDIEVLKVKQSDELGFKVNSWSDFSWIVGKEGRIIRSRDSITYETLESGVYSDLTSVSFINETDGLICGKNNTILSTFSSGDSFNVLNFELGFRDWNKVLYYENNKAILIGNNGTIIHLTRNEFNWSMDKILNNTDLLNYDIDIKQSDLENTVKLKLKYDNSDDNYIQDLTDIEYQGNGEFLLTGANDLLCHIKLVDHDKFIEPILNYYKTGIDTTWKKIHSYIDVIRNERRALILNDYSVRCFAYEKMSQDININVINVTTDTFYSSSEILKGLDIYDNNVVIVGDKVNAIRKDLYTTNYEIEELKDVFTPRMLFLDYYMGRKINIHLSDGDYVKPTGYINKNKLHCYNFIEGEYIELSETGVTENQNNFLAYQDFYYLNRRLLDVPNSWGKIQEPYNRYNKRITCVDDLNQYNFEGTDFLIENLPVTDLTNYVIGELREDSKATKITIKSSNIQIGDILNITVLSKYRDYVIVEGDVLYYQLKTSKIDIYDVCKVYNENGNLKINTRYFEESFSVGTTVNELLSSFKKQGSKSLQVANSLLGNRGVSPVDITIQTVAESFLTSTNINNISSIIVGNIMYIGSYGASNLLTIVDLTFGLINTITLTVRPVLMSYNPINKKIFVMSDQVSSYNIDIIDTTTNSIVQTYNYSSRNYLTFYNNERIYVVSGTNLRIFNNTILESTISLGAGNSPRAFTVVGDKVFLSCANNKVLVLHNNIITTITLSGLTSLKFYIESTGDFVYVAGNDNTMRVIDVNSFTQVKSISLINIQMFKLLNYNNLNRLLISDDTNITIIDTDTNTIVKSITVDMVTNFIEMTDYIYICNNSGLIKTISLFETLTSINSYQLTGNVLNIVKSGNYIYPMVQNINLEKITTGDIFPSSISIELDLMITDTVSVVRNLKDKVTLWDLWDDEMVYEASKGKILVKNLNYFNGDLEYLKWVFEKGLLGESYTMTVNEYGKVIIGGSVNDLTKYYNLEAVLTHGYYSGTTFYTENIDIKYSDDVVYGPNYDLYNFLSKISPVFTREYSFEMPDNIFTYNTKKTELDGTFKEFSIIGSKIFIGKDIYVLYETGTFIDVINNDKRVDRVYIKSVDYSNNRYVISTDKKLDTALNLNGMVRLRSRNTLGEISMDLDFTDNILCPISDNGTRGVVYYNNTFYNNQVTSKQYAKLLFNDDNIRKNISSIMFLDDDNNWNLGVIDWKGDPNFLYRPLELHEVGIDMVFKKAISVSPINYKVVGDRLSLINIDLNKFNYRLVDGLSVKELEERYYWILNADIRNAIIGESTNGLVWYMGDWICGTWEEGDFYSGKAYNIEWLKGNVYSNKVENNYNLMNITNQIDKSYTQFYNCYWYSGSFNGTWYNGVWNSGNFSGIWMNGEWISGLFDSGEFRGGVWKSGTWFSGDFSANNTYAIWENGIWLGGDFLSGRWKNGIWDQTARVKSRFGTGATLLNNAIWEYGYWKNGEFYAGTSGGYQHSYWYNGIWEKGTFFGGQIEMINWNNGVFQNGYLKSSLEIKEFRVRRNLDVISGADVEVEFVNPHFYKEIVVNGSVKQNYFTILGKPDIQLGKIHPNTELLGHNTNAGRHIIKEILDDKTVLINIADDIFPYDQTYITQGTNSLDYDRLFKMYDFSIGGNPDGMVLYDGIVYVNSSDNIYTFVNSNPQPSDTIINIENGGRVLGLGNSIYITKTDSLNTYIYNTSGIIDTIICDNNPTKVVYDTTSSTIHILNIPSNTTTIYETLTDTSYNLNHIFGAGTNELISVSGYIYYSYYNLMQVRRYNFTIGFEVAYNVGEPVEQFIAYNNKVLGRTENTVVVLSNVLEDTLNIKAVNMKNTNGITFILGDGIYTYDGALEKVSELNLVDIVYSDKFGIYIGISNDNIYILDGNFELKDVISSSYTLKQIETDSIGEMIYILSEEKLICMTDKLNIFTWELCSDYTLDEIAVVDSDEYDFETLQYQGDVRVASHWVDGRFNSGICRYIYFSSGTWYGGLWLDGVFENGVFGEG